MRGMTGIERLVDRTLLIGFEETEPPAWALRAAPRVGGIVLFGPNFRSDADAARLAAILRAEGGDEGEVLLAVDEEGGDVTRLEYHGGSRDPGNYVLGAVDDLAATERIAGQIGARLRAAGILLDFAPAADVNADPENPVIGVRAFGHDPELVARHTAAWVRGLQDRGVAGCAKHFPGHGDTRVDSHRALPVVTCSEREWRRVHLPPFAAAIEAGVRSVMTAHLRLAALDDAPATLSRRILHDLLRGELGFEGVVVTDALEMAAIAATIGVEAGAVAALAAGADALCLGALGGLERYQRVRDAIVDAVRSGDLPVARVEQAAARVEALRVWTARAERTVPATADQNDLAGVPEDLGLDLARRAAKAIGVPPLGDRPVLVELRAEPNPAVGAAAWDLATPLRDLGFPPAVTVNLEGPDGAAARLAELTAGRPLVVVGRDVARNPWQREIWAAARGVSDQAVLVDLGLPRPGELGPGAVVLVGGAARPNLRAAAELLVKGSVPVNPA